MIPVGGQRVLSWKNSGTKKCLFGCEKDCSVHLNFSKVSVHSPVAFEFDRDSITFGSDGHYVIVVSYDVHAKASVEVKLTPCHGAFTIAGEKTCGDGHIIIDKEITCGTKLEVFLADLDKCKKVGHICIEGTIYLIPE